MLKLINMHLIARSSAPRVCESKRVGSSCLWVLWSWLSFLSCPAKHFLISAHICSAKCHRFSWSWPWFLNQEALTCSLEVIVWDEMERQGSDQQVRCVLVYCPSYELLRAAPVGNFWEDLQLPSIKVLQVFEALTQNLSGSRTHYCRHHSLDHPPCVGLKRTLCHCWSRVQWIATTQLSAESEVQQNVV